MNNDYIEDYLMHRDGHKYIFRKWKNGRWHYVYQNAKNAGNKIGQAVKNDITTGSYNNGSDSKQAYVQTKNAGVVAGSNRDNNYAGVSIGSGKMEDSPKYKYMEKSIKVGKVALNYDNENGTHNLSVHVDKKKKNLSHSQIEQLEYYGKLRGM